MMNSDLSCAQIGYIETHNIFPGVIVGEANGPSNRVDLNPVRDSAQAHGLLSATPFPTYLSQWVNAIARQADVNDLADVTSQMFICTFSIAF